MSLSISASKDTLIEEVCSICPATYWGKKSICQVQNSHVGLVQSCPQWESYCDAHQKKRQQEAGAAVEWVQRMEEAIKDYQYMIKEIKRLQKSLDEADGVKVSQFGIENGQIIGKGRISDRTSSEVVRRDRKWKRLAHLQATVEQIHRAVDTTLDEKERIIIEALLDGEKNSTIAKQLGLCRQTFYDIKKMAISKMAEVMVWDKKYV